jgi:hypothetical protein
MPTLYLWMGFRFFFYSHEHEPVHIHVECEDRQTVFGLLIENGEATEITTGQYPGMTRWVRKMKEWHCS